MSTGSSAMGSAQNPGPSRTTPVTVTVIVGTGGGVWAEAGVAKRVPRVRTAQTGSVKRVSDIE